MRDECAVLRSGDGAREGAVDVAHHDDHIGQGPGQQPLEGDHRPPRLLGMGAAADAQRVVRIADIELFEEDTVHRTVVVLTRVHEQRLDPAALESIENRLHLHVVGPGTGDAHHPQWHPSSLAASCVGAKMLPLRIAASNDSTGAVD
ncbi:MAG TPA: hypothetical protein VNB94_02110 [Mycobacteriales bacterium]|nr:hypothetical protein [Mycobacteriales bacterium]